MEKQDLYDRIKITHAIIGGMGNLTTSNEDMLVTLILNQLAIMEALKSINRDAEIS
jgi:hypothetical protein